MNLRDLHTLSSDADTGFELRIRLTVDDARALWSAAAERAMAVPGMTLADVLDTIGPREDPAVADCLAMLAAPAPIAGCTLEAFDVVERADQASVVPILLPAAPALRALRG